MGFNDEYCISIFKSNFIMKCILLSFILFLFAGTIQAQCPIDPHRAQINAGVGLSNWGIPVYFGVDYCVVRDLTIGGEASMRLFNNTFAGNNNQTVFGISGNGNYHFNRLLKINKNWDFYAGLNLGLFLWKNTNNNGGGSTRLGLGGQIGGRYYFGKAFGLNLEVGGGNVFGGGKFGFSIRM